MNIIARVHLYLPDHCAGAELTLHTLLRALVERGHRCQVLLIHPSPTDRAYTIDGVTVHPLGSGEDHERAIRNADIAITHLDAAQHTCTLAHRFEIPLVQLAHNNFPETTGAELSRPTSLVVYNSRWLAESLNAPWPSMVIPPPVLPDDYRTTPGDKVTLVNMMDAKGGQLFWRLARDMPDVEFQAVVGGYGQQIIRYDHPNVTVVEHTTDMRSVYAETSILLMPSSYESWGRVGIEAMCSGIPVIAHPTPGLQESLDDAGIFINRDYPERWQETIRGLLADPDDYRAASEAALRRAAELDPSKLLDEWCDTIENLPAQAVAS